MYFPTREPRAANKYKLTFESCRKLKVGDRSKISEDMFWRNDVIHAWCISKAVWRGFADVWLGIYDTTAPTHAGEFRFDFSSDYGMVTYKFSKFFDPKEMDGPADFEVQEAFLEVVNELLDAGILVK